MIIHNFNIEKNHKKDMAVKLEKIIIKISSSEIEKIEAIIEKMALIPSVEMSGLSYGQLGSDIIASFDIDDGHFAIMVEKLYSNNLNVLPTNDKVTQVLEFLYDKYGRKSFVKVPQASTASSANPTPEAVKEFKETGRYEELIKIAKMVNVDTALKNDAKNAIPDSIKVAIDQLYNSAMINKHTVPNALASLMKICGDMSLKTLSLQSMQKRAGMSAIALCENYPDHLDELVKISNNGQIPNVINVKAISKFWEIISKNMEKHPSDIAAAIKNSNLRFLENAYDIAHIELNDEEKVFFTDFKNYYRLNKK
jgi:hypothetical protein